jgi:hypothetical protein
MCRNTSLGLATKARVYKGASQKWSPKVTFHVLGNVRKCEKMNLHTPKWAPTLGVRVSMDSQRILESLESDCRGQNPLEWKVSYIIRKLLERKCLKWIHVTHFGHLKHKLWPKKGPKSNCQFHFWLLNVGNRFDSLACRWRATYCWEALNKGYNFALNITLIKGLHTKLWASKVMGVPILGISRLPLGSLKTKWHLGASNVARHKEYYKGEDGGFPQVRAMVSLVSLCLHVAHPCTKGVPTTH